MFKVKATIVSTRSSAILKLLQSKLVWWYIITRQGKTPWKDFLAFTQGVRQRIWLERLWTRLLPLLAIPISVISLCGRTYQTETDMWGDMFYSATITLVPPVTLVLHGLLPLHPLYNIPVLLHNIWHPLSFEQIPLIKIYQINHTLIKTINLQLFLSPWKTLRLWSIHTTIIILCSFTHKIILFLSYIC